MLVLTRKQSERIKIGPDVYITVVRVQGERVRIGIEAPSDLRIVRTELEEQEPPAPPSDVPAAA